MNQKRSEGRKDCRTSNGVLIARAKDLCEDSACTGEVESCYGGQWTIHPAHDYTILLQNYLGGGKRKIHCPGKTSETVLR